MQTWLLHSTEDYFKAVGGGTEGNGEGFIEFVLLEAAVKRIRDVGEVDRLACWRSVALCVGEHAGGSSNNFGGGMVEVMFGKMIFPPRRSHSTESDQNP